MKVEGIRSVSRGNPCEGLAVALKPRVPSLIQEPSCCQSYSQPSQGWLNARRPRLGGVSGKSLLHLSGLLYSGARRQVSG
jgi:hypothetical protein